MATRANHQAPGQRNLLIMADGHRRVSELLKAGTDPERCMQALRGLCDDGYLWCATLPQPPQTYQTPSLPLPLPYRYRGQI